jgi:hypothetical protein
MGTKVNIAFQKQSYCKPRDLADLGVNWITRSDLTTVLSQKSLRFLITGSIYCITDRPCLGLAAYRYSKIC